MENLIKGESVCIQIKSKTILITNYARLISIHGDGSVETICYNYWIQDDMIQIINSTLAIFGDKPSIDILYVKKLLEDMRDISVGNNLKLRNLESDVERYRMKTQMMSRNFKTKL